MHKKQKHFYCDCIMNYVIVLWNIPLLVRYPQTYVLLSIILLNRLPLHLVNVYGTTSYFAFVTIHVLLSTRATSYDRRTDRWKMGETYNVLLGQSDKDSCFRMPVTFCFDEIFRAKKLHAEASTHLVRLA